MSIRPERFQFHRAQKIAAAFLLVFLLQAMWLLAHLPLSLAETRSTLAGQALWSSRRLLAHESPLLPGDSAVALRSAGILPALASRLQSEGQRFSIYAAPSRWLVRLPFALFGVWLGGALWWVARRMFNDTGGYVALALYCASAPMLIAASTANAAILAAWGLFGVVFTGIGVAHTLYAPPRKWRPRILLLGLAIGLTAAASVNAALAGVALAACFMLYLVPGRRIAALLILATSSAIGLGIFFLCFGFRFRDLTAAAPFAMSAHPDLGILHLKQFLSVPGAMLELVAFAGCFIIFLLWRRARYFGNTAPLLVVFALLLWPVRVPATETFVWTLPFIFVFIGGIYADLLEPAFFGGRFSKLVATTAFFLIGASLVLSGMVLAGS